MADRPSHFAAVLQALLVTFLWATSWVLIKIGLKDVPAITFAGLRYGIAFVCLLPFALRAGMAGRLRRLSSLQWGQLLLLGLLYYAVTQGTQFAALVYLPAATLSLLLSFSAALVALLGIFLLGEHPRARQWAGVGLYLAGALAYFYPAAFSSGEIRGLLIGISGLIANVASSLLGRRMNASGALEPVVVTCASMGVGACVLMAGGLALQGLPPLGAGAWAIVLWLAVVNTAFAFTLWNHTLRTLPALESSIINSTMLVQIPVLAWLFLGESISLQKGFALLIALAGIAVVQLSGTRAVAETAGSAVKPAGLG